MNWFIDFDDTLAVGPITWSLTNVFPRLIEKYRLNHNPVQFNQTLWVAQQQAAETGDEQLVLSALFTTLNWPHSLADELLRETFDNYRPSLFDDSLPFLESLYSAGHGVFILSNNNHAPTIANALNVSAYIHDFFTPHTCGLAHGKPSVEIWRHAVEQTRSTSHAIIGDDPWTDAALAHQVKVPCWIIDRLARFQTQPYPCHTVRNLTQIPATGSAE